MLRAVKNVFLDRTNRPGAAEVAADDDQAAASSHCSESSGSELVNDQILDSDASTCTPLPPISPDDSDLESNPLSAMHHETEEDGFRDPGQNWHFTQYGYRQRSTTIDQ